MLNPSLTNRFRKDYKAMEMRGYEMSKIDEVINTLLKEKPLPPEKRDHPLSGNWKGHRECHIEPNWLLVYRIKETELLLSLTRTGSHSDIFH